MDISNIAIELDYQFISGSGELLTDVYESVLR